MRPVRPLALVVMASLAALATNASTSMAQSGTLTLSKQTLQPALGKTFQPQINPDIVRGASCVDLAAVAAQRPLSDGRIQVSYGVRNVSTVAYNSGRNQQLVRVLRNGRQVAVIPFADLAAGRKLLRSEVYSPFEFPATYEIQLSFDPDIRRDGNSANDDCRSGNNQTRLVTAR